MEEHQCMTYLLPLLLLLTPLSCFLATLLHKASAKLPPGPYPWPVIGSLLQLGKKVHVDLAKLAQIHGPIMSLKLGNQLAIVASSPVSAAQILKNHDRILAARYVPQTFRIKNYIEFSLPWALCDERWKALRTVCRGELFTSKTLDVHSKTREEKVSEMVRFLLEEQEEAVNIGELVFRTVFNILGNVIFSRDAFDLVDKDGVSWGLKNHISRMMEVGAAPNVGDFYPVIAGLDLQGLNKEATAFAAKIYGVWDGLIRERKEIGIDSKKDFLDMLLAAEFSDLQIKALISDLFVAGTDTSTTLVEWTMSELTRNPEAMQKVRDELETVVGYRRNGENAVRESHLVGLSYLHACVKETLRLHPPVPLLLPREALDRCEVMNYTIPKGSRIMVNLWAIGRDPETWKDPLIFSPERFLESGLDYKGKDYEFTPFGAGRRICPGLPLASRVVQLIVASLIHNFDWSLPDGLQPIDLNMDERFGLTLEREHPLLLVPKNLV